MKNWQFILVLGLLFVWTPLCLVGYERFVAEKAAPYVPPPPPLVAAAREYQKTLGSTYHQVALKVKSGDFTTKEEIVNALKEHAKPLAAAQDAAISSMLDESGKVKNPQGASDMLDQVSQALGVTS